MGISYAHYWSYGGCCARSGLTGHPADLYRNIVCGHLSAHIWRDRRPQGQCSMPRPRNTPQTHSLRYLQVQQVAYTARPTAPDRPRPARRIRSPRARRRPRRWRRAACRTGSCARAHARPDTASARDVAIAHTGAATAAMPPRHVRNRTRAGRAVRRARRRRRRARQRLAGQEVVHRTCRPGSSR